MSRLYAVAIHIKEKEVMISRGCKGVYIEGVVGKKEMREIMLLYLNLKITTPKKKKTVLFPTLLLLPSFFI